jgi:DNA-binding FadR family transcriptional regulator
LNTKKPDIAREAMRDHLDSSYKKIAVLMAEQEKQ